MFSEKNIPKLIIFAPILTIIALSSMILYSLITIQKDYLDEEVKKVEKNYIKNQKVILEKEIGYIYDYIQYHKKITLDNIKKNLNTQMETFYKTLEEKTPNSKEYLEIINQYSNKNSDFIIYKEKENFFIKNEDVFFYKEDIESLKEEIKKKKVLYIIREETNLFYYKFYEKENLIIAIKRDIYDDIDNLKETITRWSEYLRFGDNNYFWIYKNTNILLSHPYRKDNIGKDDTLLLDGKGDYFVQRFVKEAIKNKDGAFVEYYWNKPEQIKKIKKLTYVKLYKEWNWVIGAGVYFDDLQKVISERKTDLKNTIFEYIKITTIISLFLIMLMSYIAVEISRKINQTISSYQEKVKNREEKLKDLNKNLNNKVEFAIKEAKAKDRAMLHQSRLARMGTLINMISHQWRQPLSQLSGIIMELETSIEFKKAKKKYILTSLSDATSIIEHMSFTIEDFKNFFRPEKKKEEFLISKACEDAKALIKDTFTNENIKLNTHVIKDKKIKGYKREYSQVILNLLINAKDELISKEIEDKKIEFIIDVKKDKSVVFVKDNAGGIKIDNIEMIFEPYFSTKKTQGTGLGLYMSKMIIEKHMEGSLSVSNDKNGAIFKIEV